MRLVRVFRIVKLGARYNKLTLIGTVLTEAQDVLAMLLGLLFLVGAHLLLFVTSSILSEIAAPTFKER